MAALAAVAAVVGPAGQAWAFLDFIIFDPSALTQHAQQVVQVAEQVRQAVQQVRGGILEIAHLRGDALPDAITTATSLAKQMEAHVYTVANPAGQLGQTYPTDLSGVSADRYAADQAGWVDAERASLVEIAYLGYTTAQPLLDQIGRLSGPVAFFKNFPEIAFLFLAVVAIIAAFCVITVQVVLAVLGFKFGSLAAFVLVPFAVLSKTAFIAERPLGYVVAAGVRLMVMTLVLGVGNGVFQQLKMPPGGTVTTYQAFCVALSAVLLAVLSFTASRLATDLVTGGPSLGVGAAVNTTVAAYRTAAGGLSARPTVLAVKAAAAVGSGGASLAGSAAVRVAGSAVRGVRSAGRPDPASSRPSPAPQTTPTPAGGTTAEATPTNSKRKKP